MQLLCRFNIVRNHFWIHPINEGIDLDFFQYWIALIKLTFLDINISFYTFSLLVWRSIWLISELVDFWTGWHFRFTHYHTAFLSLFVAALWRNFDQLSVSFLVKLFFTSLTTNFRDCFSLLKTTTTTTGWSQSFLGTCWSRYLKSLWKQQNK